MGWTIPVLVDEAGGIIAGHGRVMAAHRLGIEDVPVMVAAGWTDAKKRAYMLADNKLTLNSEWDLDRLAIEIAELRESDSNISLIGFSESEIDDLLKADGDGDSGPGAGSLAERFMIPPFSVLRARRLVAGAQGGVVGVRHPKRAGAWGDGERQNKRRGRRQGEIFPQRRTCWKRTGTR